MNTLAILLTTAILTHGTTLFLDYEPPITPKYSEMELNCLAKNVYFESRGEPLIGQLAVAYVTINRSEDDAYSDNLCGVVYDPKQFSWTTGKQDPITETNSWIQAVLVAELATADVLLDPTEGAIMFHADTIEPYWADDFKQTVEISDHIFYKEKTL